MRSQSNILLLLVASCAMKVSGKVVFQHTPSFDLHRVAQPSALNELLETSAILNDIVWIENDPHLYWNDCTPVNNFEEKIEQDHNQTTVYLSVTQPCVEDNIALTDFQVSVDAGRRLSVSAKVSSGDNASLSKQYQLPSLAASSLISAAYTPDRVLRVTIPHLSPDDLAPTDIPITIEPAPEPQHPAAAEQPTQEQTHATVGKKVELLPEQQDVEGVRCKVDVESNPINVQSQEMPVLESGSGIDSDIPRKPQGKEKEGKREREERLRAYLLEYEGKRAAYSDDITRLASFRGVNSRDGLPSHDNSEHNLFSTGNSKHRSDDQPHTVAPTTGNQRKPQREAAKPYYLQDVGAESATQEKGSPTTSSFPTPSASPTKVHIADDSYIAGAKARAAEGKTSKRAAAPTAGVSSEKEPKSTTEKQSLVDQKPASGNKKPAAGNKQPASPEPKKETRGSQPTTAEPAVNKEQQEQQKPPESSSSSHQRTEKEKHQPGRVEQSHRQERKHQPERVGARESLRAQDDPYRPMPTKRAVQKAEEEASMRRMHSDDVKENVRRLEGELARLRSLLATA